MLLERKVLFKLLTLFYVLVVVIVAHVVISFIVSKIAHAGMKYLTSSLGVVPLDSFKTMLSALEN